MKVSEAMTRDVRVASPEQTIQEAARTMAELDTGVLPVGLPHVITLGTPARSTPARTPFGRSGFAEGDLGFVSFAPIADDQGWSPNVNCRGRL